jgi:hypothetical protein
VDVFIDDSLVKSSSFENNALRLNDGPVVLFASNRDTEMATIIDADIVDLTYHNYAMNILDCEKKYNAGFNNEMCQLPESWSGSKVNGQVYNKINLYNETRQI